MSIGFFFPLTYRKCFTILVIYILKIHYKEINKIGWKILTCILVFFCYLFTKILGNFTGTAWEGWEALFPLLEHSNNAVRYLYLLFQLCGSSMFDCVAVLQNRLKQPFFLKLFALPQKWKKKRKRENVISPSIF